MIEKISFLHLRFSLIPESILHMPAFHKGSVLRGAFGSSLRRVVCIAGSNASCPTCMVRERCAYSLIFSPEGISPAKRLQSAPRGYVFKPPLERTTEYTPENPFSFDMILIGDRIPSLPYVILPFYELGKRGIGPKRGRFSLGAIISIKEGITENVYDPATQTVRKSERIITGPYLDQSVQRGSRRLTLRFLTPTRIKYNPTGEKGRSRVVRVPEFHHLIRRLRDRISALSAAYCGGPLEIDFRGIAERAQKVRTKEVNLRWIEKKRQSRTQPAEHDQSGFIGSITFEGDLHEFMPLLALGEYVHVGEDAVFGNGWYRIVK